MKKVLTAILALVCLLSVGTSTVFADEPTVELAKNCKSAYLCDWNSGTRIYAKDEMNHLPIASMCKIMTLILCMDELESGSLKADEGITVSERASGMGGSQVFLETGATYPASDLIKSICIASANDSCVAMAERIAGSEELFIAKMNERAKSLGANDTVFVNCTGLPKQGQYSCAKDVACMLGELLRHEEYFAYSKIWMDEINHPQGRKTEMANTNKLIRFYSGCDAGKTGFTNEAGFCLAASAKRGAMRLVSVVIGGADSKARFNGVSSMLDYGFATCENKVAVDGESVLNEKCEVSGGKQGSVCVKPQRSSYVFVNRTENPEIMTEVTMFGLRAPVKTGDVAGEIVVYKNGVETDRVPLLANEDVAKSSLWDSIRDIAQNWNI